MAIAPTYCGCVSFTADTSRPTANRIKPIISFITRLRRFYVPRVTDLPRKGQAQDYWKLEVLLTPCRRPSYLGLLVFLVPDLWFPQFDFVSFGIHYPGKFPVLVEFGTLKNLDAAIL